MLSPLPGKAGEGEVWPEKTDRKAGGGGTGRGDEGAAEGSPGEFRVRGAGFLSSLAGVDTLRA